MGDDGRLAEPEVGCLQILMGRRGATRYAINAGKNTYPEPEGDPSVHRSRRESKRERLRSANEAVLRRRDLE